MTFNAVLAREVLAVIERVNAAQQVTDLPTGERIAADWAQSDWRDLYVYPTPETSAGFACRTSMCFAGWTAEIQGNWLLSTQSWLDMDPADRGIVQSNLVVTTDSDKPWATDFVTWLSQRKADFSDPATAELVFKRQHGDLEDLQVMTVDLWAGQQLGLGHDPLLMFSGDHGLAQLRFIVDFYDRYGTEASTPCYHHEEVRRAMPAWYETHACWGYDA